MPADPASIPIARLISLFAALLIMGLLLTLPLFRFRWDTFRRSKLFTKIMWWIPIFLIFVLFLYRSDETRLIMLLILVVLALRELLGVMQHARADRLLMAVYFLLFTLALLQAYRIGRSYPSHDLSVLITLGFASVLADVTAFFMGNYLGRHKLPAALNERKSWEGVAGQFIGALIGVVLVNTFVMPVTSIWLFLPIGAGAAAGDLANSYVKRRLNIKDWSHSIPGHGGYLDRLCSLAGSAALTFYFLRFITFG